MFDAIKTNPFHAIRSAISATDIRTSGKSVTGNDRKGAALTHAVNGVIQAFNGAVAGTPVAWVSGPIAMAVAGAEWGFGALLSFLSAGITLGGNDDGKGLRHEAVGAFIAGACAAVPVWGTYVNWSAAGYNGVHFVNNLADNKA
jgi:hypothetical protein